MYYIFQRAVHLTYLAQLRLAQGRIHGAIEVCNQSLAHFEGPGIEHRSTEAFSLLGYLLYLVGDYDAALENLARALEMAHRRGDRRFEATALVRLGHVYVAQAQLDQARVAYSRAYKLRQDLAQYRLSLDPLVGMVQVAWLQGCMDDVAWGRLEQLYGRLAQQPMDYIAEGSQVYMTCYQVLNALDDPRAPEMLRMAQEHLETRCAALDDEAARAAFRNLPMHQPFFREAVHPM